jgi:hypothetical protein
VLRIGLLASLTQTPKYNVSTIAPVLFQLNVALVEWPWIVC